MKTKAAFFRSRAVLVAGALLITVFADGCITHPPNNNTSQANTAPAATTTTKKQRRKRITHPPNKRRDRSKDMPVGAAPPAPAPITHPGN